MGRYIGPDRRRAERRERQPDRERPLDIGLAGLDRRRAERRRQDALAGVIVGLSGEEMQTLARLWRQYEASQRPGREEDRIVAAAARAGHVVSLAPAAEHVGAAKAWAGGAGP